MFSTIWHVVKIFLDAKTQNKIKILGSDYKKELLKHVDEEQLLQQFGGKMPDDCLFRNFGPWNPKGLELFGSKAQKEQKNHHILSKGPEPVLESYHFDIENEENVEKLRKKISHNF